MNYYLDRWKKATKKLNKSVAHRIFDETCIYTHYIYIYHIYIYICIMVKIRLLRAFIFHLFLFLIDVFFDVDSKSTIGFLRSHVVFEL